MRSACCRDLVGVPWGSLREELQDTAFPPGIYIRCVTLASSVAFSVESDIVVSNTIGVASLQYTKRLVNAIAHTTPAHPAIGQSAVNRVTHRIISAVGTSPEKTIP